MKKSALAAMLALSLATTALCGTAMASGSRFTDVKSGDWFCEYVELACEMGVVSGRGDNTYMPSENMSYAEAVKLAACIHQKDATGKVTLENGSPWYQSYVDYCLEEGILVDDDYDWNASITRIGYIDLFSRALPMDKLKVQNDIEDGSIPDVAMDNEYVDEIYALYRAGIVTGSGDKHECKPYDNITRAEVATAVVRMLDEDYRISDLQMKPYFDEAKARYTMMDAYARSIIYKYVCQREDVKYTKLTHDDGSYTYVVKCNDGTRDEIYMCVDVKGYDIKVSLITDTSVSGRMFLRTQGDTGKLVLEQVCATSMYMQSYYAMYDWGLSGSYFAEHGYSMRGGNDSYLLDGATSNKWAYDTRINALNLKPIEDKLVALTDDFFTVNLGITENAKDSMLKEMCDEGIVELYGTDKDCYKSNQAKVETYISTPTAIPVSDYNFAIFGYWTPTNIEFSVANNNATATISAAE